MKKILLLIMMLSATLSALAGDDVTMLTRDGEVLDIKLDRITTDKVYFINLKKKRRGTQIAPKDFVYMIKNEKKSTTFFNEDGEEFTMKSIKVEKDDDVVYLMKGCELVVYDLNVRGDEVSFKLSKKKKDKVCTYKKSDIFMIRYSDGHKSLFAKPYTSKVAQTATPPTTLAQNAEPAVSQPAATTPQKLPDAATGTSLSQTPAEQPQTQTAPLLASTVQKSFSPAANLSEQEIVNKVYAANPYTLFKKGAEAEYCFSQGGKDAKIAGIATYVIQKIADVKIVNGLYVAYFKQELYNMKHEPSKGISAKFKDAMYPTEIDTAGVFHWTHDPLRELYLVEKKKGYAALMSNELAQDIPLQTNKMVMSCKALFGGSSNVTFDYTGLKVLGYENVTTPAGTFECLKIAGDVVQEEKGRSDIKTSDTIWFARGIGIVKHELNEGSSSGPFVMYLNKLTNN